jgi:hypothetical protein
MKLFLGIGLCFLLIYLRNTPLHLFLYCFFYYLKIECNQLCQTVTCVTVCVLEYFILSWEGSGIENAGGHEGP